MADKMKTVWNVFGVVKDGVNPDEVYGRRWRSEDVRAVDTWPQAETCDTVGRVEIHLHGDEPSSAFLQVLGFDLDKAKERWDAVAALLGDTTRFWPKKENDSHE